MELAKAKRECFFTVYFVCREFFENLHFISMYSVLNTLQNIHTFTYQKTLLHTFLLLVSKIVKRLQCILNFFFLSIHCSIRFWNTKSIKQQSQSKYLNIFVGYVKLKYSNDAAILCELWNKWNYLNSVQVNLMDYEKLKSDPSPWFCPPCINELLFAITSKLDFANLYCSCPLLFVLWKSTVKSFSKKGKELLKRIKDLNHIFGWSTNSISCDYFDIKDLRNAKINRKTYQFYTLTFLQ